MSHSTTPAGHDVSHPTDHGDHGHGAALPVAPQIVLPKIAIVHIVVGLVLTYAGLFTMMTVVFAAWGAWLATVGPMYVALMLPLSLRNAEVR